MLTLLFCRGIKPQGGKNMEQTQTQTEYIFGLVGQNIADIFIRGITRYYRLITNTDLRVIDIVDTIDYKSVFTGNPIDLSQLTHCRRFNTQGDCERRYYIYDPRYNY